MDSSKGNMKQKSISSFFAPSAGGDKAQAKISSFFAKPGGFGSARPHHFTLACDVRCHWPPGVAKSAFNA